MIRARKAVAGARRRRGGRDGSSRGELGVAAAGEHGHDRLGVRRQRRDGAVRRSGARDREGSRQTGEPRKSGVNLQDHDVRHAGQQAGDGQGLRGSAARAGGRRDLHDLRRRLRRAGRAGVDQRRQAHDRALHRHRPDGPEALRGEGAPCVLLRQRRAGRRLGDGRVRVAARLARRGARDRHGDRLLPERRPGVRGPLAPARRQHRRGGDVPVARRQPGVLAERRHAAERRGRGRDRHRRRPAPSERRLRS